MKFVSIQTCSCYIIARNFPLESIGGNSEKKRTESLEYSMSSKCFCQPMSLTFPISGPLIVQTEMSLKATLFY